jgi:hypothetical protein
MSDVTCIPDAIEQEDPHAAEQLLPQAYDGLRKLVAQRLAQGKPGQTLQSTGLVYGEYFRHVVEEGARHYKSRGRFFAAPAEALRGNLVHSARRRGAQQRRARLEHTVSPVLNKPSMDDPIDILALDEALEGPSRQAPFLAGCTRRRRLRC